MYQRSYRPANRLAATVFCAVALCPGDFTTRVAHASGGLRTVALTGMPMPGADGVFGDVGYFGVSLNNHGETAFLATSTQYEYDSFGRPVRPIVDATLWTEAGRAGLRRIDHESVVTQDGESLLSVAGGPILNDVGETFFGGRASTAFTRPWVSTYSIYRDTVAVGIDAVAETRPFDLLNPPDDELWFSSLSRPAISSTGEISFQASLWGDFERFDSLRVETASGLTDLVVRRGDPVPGFDATFADFRAPAAVGPNGSVMFEARFVESGGRSRQSYWERDSAGELKLIAAQGVAGLPGGSTPRSLDGLRAADTGEAMFATDFGSTNEAYWRRGLDGRIERIATPASSPPDIEIVSLPGRTTASVFTRGAIGSNGHVAFRAEVPTVNGQTEGLWKSAPNGDLSPVALGGQIAPGTDEPLVSVEFEIAVNALGQVAFGGRTVDFSTNNYGIWAQDSDGALRSIAIAGELLDVSDDPRTPDLRTVDYVNASLDLDRGKVSPYAFNDRGQIAFFARFTDGTSGVFVSDAVAIPEPASLLGIVLLPLAMKRR